MIFFLGDGMSVPTIAAAHILAGQRQLGHLPQPFPAAGLPGQSRAQRVDDQGRRLARQQALDHRQHGGTAEDRHAGKPMGGSDAGDGPPDGGLPGGGLSDDGLPDGDPMVQVLGQNPAMLVPLEHAHGLRLVPRLEVPPERLEGLVVFGVSVEGLENGDDAALFSHVVYGQVANFVNGYRGYTYAVPPWFAEGLAHWFSRRVDTNFVNITIKDEDNVDPKQQHEWAKKVRARLQFDRTTIPLATLQDVATSADLGYHMHLQSWSRIDFLMARDRSKVGEVLFRMKSLPPGTPAKAVRDALLAALADVTGLDAAAFDAQWREWVLKTYPKK